MSNLVPMLGPPVLLCYLTFNDERSGTVAPSGMLAHIGESDPNTHSMLWDRVNTFMTAFVSGPRIGHSTSLDTALNNVSCDYYARVKPRGTYPGNLLT